jgi:hypothetical protein
VAELLASCPDQQRAYENWMARDDEIAIHVASQASALELPYLKVDGDAGEAKTVAELAWRFRLAH